jgi:hypothetical protein
MSRVSGHEVAERELKFGIVSTKYADEQRIHIQTDQLVGEFSAINELSGQRLSTTVTEHTHILTMFTLRGTCMHGRGDGVFPHTGFPRTLTMTNHVSALFRTLNPILSVNNLSRLECAETRVCARIMTLY